MAATTRNRSTSPADRGGKFFGEARLANTDLAANQNHAALSLRGLAPARQQRIHLTCASHERRLFKCAAAQHDTRSLSIGYRQRNNELRAQNTFGLLKH